MYQYYVWMWIDDGKADGWGLLYIVQPTKICIGALFWCITLHDANENMLHCYQVRRFYEFYMSFSASFLPSFTGFASLFWLFVIYSRFLFRWVFWGFYLFAVLLAAFRFVLFCLFCFFRIFLTLSSLLCFLSFFPKRRNRTQKRFAFFIAEEASFNSYVLFNFTASSNYPTLFVFLISRFIPSLLVSF